MAQILERKVRKITLYLAATYEKNDYYFFGLSRGYVLAGVRSRAGMEFR
jgi:uncharacterized protein (DUF2235 family)